MPALQFKEQFVPAILSGQKRHTIRRNRAKDWKVGDTIQFFAVGNTPKVRQFGEARVARLEKIEIWQGGYTRVRVGGESLGVCDVLELARNDGFEGKDAQKDFMRFFYDHYGIYFKGQIIHWEDFKSTEGGKQ